jgi:acyl-CoA thioester hydrolase
MSGPAPTAGWLEGREHVLPVRIYYEDTDFTGIVYHANYLRYFERGRSDFLRVAGVNHTDLAEQNAAFAVTRMIIDYRRSARVDDALLVRTLYDRMKGLICEAEVEAACIDSQGRARRPPPGLAEAVGPLLAP